MHFLHKLYTAWNIVYRKAILHFFWLFPIKKNKIVFTSYFGKQYSDNPMYISKKMEKNRALEIVWICQALDVIPKNVKRVSPNSIDAIRELATAKVWVDNCRKPLWLSKRKGQFYVQTWHGGVCIKQVEAHTQETLPKMYVKSAKRDSKMADLFISECSWRSNNYREAFWYKGAILESGIPRSDVFFDDESSVKNKVFSYYNLNSDARLILYAPTFRNSNDTGCYELDMKPIIESLEKRFGGQWFCLYRLHPNMNYLQNAIHYGDKILNGSLYQDMNELLMVSDVLITDYSGCLFDGMRIGKKVFILAKDYDDYIRNERALYFDIKRLPAPFSRNKDELINNILLFNNNKYDEEREKFVSQMGYYSQGNAASYISEYLMDILESED